MNLDEAQTIASNFGSFVEWTYIRLKPIFGSKMPKSILPNSVKQTEEALNIVSKYHHGINDYSIVKAIETTSMTLMSFIDDKEAFISSYKSLSRKEWYEGMLGIIKDFSQLYGEPQHISGFFKETPIGQVDFINMSLDTARIIIDLYSSYLTHAQMRLSFIFQNKIPESFLPLKKNILLKACELYAQTYNSLSDKERADLFIYQKNILEEDYIDDEIAMSELLKNFSDEEIRESIIDEIKEFQKKSPGSDYIDLLGLGHMVKNPNK